MPIPLPKLISLVGQAVVTNDLYQAAKQAQTNYDYEAVVAEIARRIGAREYDGWPAKPGYRVAGGEVKMWMPGKKLTDRPDHTMPLIDLVRREIPNVGKPAAARPQQPQAAGGPRTQWGEPIDDEPPKKKKPGDPKQQKLF
ncbi:hypothetical protein SE17_17425 [Kouleothrix aurantiaca]|uniref:Uncharacterized protein n=1 Tax=Kouleothrix aurantiaca TaxID=186479 RepID=A0A0P9HCA2_9CHLR|nr:hypothetical protein SE17_17425 [Kouleothrix aurantiaca]